MIQTTAKALKVTLVLDPAPLVGITVPDGVPRQTLAVLVDGRRVTAELASKSLRRAIAGITEHGIDGVACVLQGKLAPSGNAIVEAGLSALPKAPKPTTMETR